jgi:hypothetical protein
MFKYFYHVHNIFNTRYNIISYLNRLMTHGWVTTVQLAQITERNFESRK